MMNKYTEISYEDQGTLLKGLLAFPEGGEKRPLVMLCHAWAGRDSFICDKAKLIADLGYTAFALDIYGKGIVGKSKDENAALKKPFIADRALLQRRLLKGYHKACSLYNPTRIAVLGFGFGGICALDLARSGVSLDGVISIYGHFDSPKNCLIHPITAKVLILHGASDPISPLSELEAFQRVMTESGVDWQTHLYGNAYHAFATPAANDLPAGLLYHPIAAKRAWKQVEGFLAEVLLS